jgi:NAD-dependent dihydropyrimidine dehydrogenase PreA subunit
MLMNIDKEKCIGCGACQPYCPIGAIVFEPQEKRKKSEVVQSDCVECGACLRSGVCPKDAIYTKELEWPRSIRPRFSNPYAAPLPGREGAPPPPEPKLNEVAGRIGKDSTAVVVEVGRPGVSTSLADVEKVCKALARSGVSFDPGSSVTGLMADPASGTLQSDVLGERVMHAMIHYTCSNDDLPESLRALKEVSAEVNTVFSLGFSNLLIDGVAPAITIAEEEGFTVKPHAKTNVGLGPTQKKEVRP